MFSRAELTLWVFIANLKSWTPIQFSVWNYLNEFQKMCFSVSDVQAEYGPTVFFLRSWLEVESVMMVECKCTVYIYIHIMLYNVYVYLYIFI